ncbi:MAG: nitrite reductase small subunit NirD [Bacteroidota bacterium]
MSTAISATPTYTSVAPATVTNWVYAGRTVQFPDGVGGTIKHGDRQIAVFYFARQDKWYACQNLCPHKLENVLGRGLTGLEGEIPTIACPLHKKTFSLLDGENLGGDCPPLALYPVWVDQGKVYVGFAD